MIPRLLYSFLFFVIGFQQAAPAQPPSQPASANTFRIAGIVVDAFSGEPLARASVALQPRNPAEGRFASTGATGVFAFENLPPGRYSLFARHKGHIAQFYKQHENFSSAVVVGPDLDTTHLRFEMRPGASISGQIVNEMNEPVRDAQITLFRQGLRNGARATAVERRAMTDDLGRYRFGRLAPDTYFVSVSARPWYASNANPQFADPSEPGSLQVFNSSADASQDALLDVAYPITFFPNATDLAGAAPITLRSGDAEVADISLHPVPAIHVRVQVPPEQQQSSVRVTEPLADNLQESPQSNIWRPAPGVIEIAGLPPGKFKLSLVSQMGEQVSRSQTVQLTGNTEIAAQDSPVAAAVSGSLLTDDASPLPRQLNILLRNTATGDRFNAQSNPQGEFAFKDRPVPVGAYEASILQCSACAIKSLTASGAKVSGRVIEITSAQDVSLKIIFAKGTGEVTGFAMKDGKPVDGVMILLVSNDSQRDPALVRRDQSDSDGSFNLNAVVSGSYTVLAIENGWDLQWSDPSVLKKCLSSGQPLQVTTNSKHQLTLTVIGGLQ